MHAIIRAGLRATIALFVCATVASAAQYPGWGDTGWSWNNKRDCCNDAIDIAASYSANACENTGGVPSRFSGASQRGTCSAQWMQADDGSLVYRCYGEASVWCR